MDRKEAERVGKKRERKEKESEEGIEKLEKKEERGGRLRRRQKNKEKKRKPKEQTLCLSTKTPLRGSAVKARPAAARARAQGPQTRGPWRERSLRPGGSRLGRAQNPTPSRSSRARGAQE